MADPVSPPRLDELVAPGQRFLFGMLLLVGQVLVAPAAGLLTESLPLRLAVASLALLLPPLVLALWLGVSARASFALHSIAPSQLGWCVLIGTGLVPAMVVLGALNSTLIQPDPTFLEAMDQLSPSGTIEWIAIGALAAGLVPLAEELVFRGVLQDAARAALGSGPAAVIVGLMFALVHFEPWYLLPLAVIGIVLGLVRIITGSVLACAVIHGTYNLGAMVLSHFGRETGPGMNPSVLVLVLASVGGLWLAWLGLGRLRPAADSLPEDPPHEGPAPD